jgi:hypothetical protein
MSNSIDYIENILIETFDEFMENIQKIKWVGREREAISLFAFEFLTEKCKQNTPLSSRSQISIESAVPQIRLTENSKLVVNKDLVIWSSPFQTVWDQNYTVSNHPIAIMEWKLISPLNKGRDNDSKVTQNDIKWLIDYSVFIKEFVGFSVFINLFFDGTVNSHLNIIKSGIVKNIR